ALFDAIDSAFGRIQANPQPDRISAIVVLTDGEDNRSAHRLQDLLKQIHAGSEDQAVRIFTIGYGKDAAVGVLKSIADQTQARFYAGDPKNIREVFKDISTFF